MTNGSFEYFEVEADIGVLGRGPDLAAAFVQTALGALTLVVDPATVEAREVREVRAHGDSPEALLVNWINECLYVHEIEAFAVHRIELVTFEPDAGGSEPCRLHSLLHGEEIDRLRHRLGTVVKAATFHQVSVVSSPKGASGRIVLDV
jgi:SHS2 domain-containing protein